MQLNMRRGCFRCAAPLAIVATVFAGSVGLGTKALRAQATAPSSAAGRALGTVKAVSGGSLTVTTDAGATVVVTLGAAARVQQLAPGSTDLKTAEAATADAIAVGDRVLASGTPGEGGALTATRVILMKSSAIAQRNQSTQADWNRRGTGGIVTAIDPLTGSISVSSGTRKIAVDTTKSTQFRRYAPGSVKFEDARPGTLADVHPGDQLRARGEKAADGLTVAADEVVSGSFRNLSGTIASINVSAGSFVVKDLATKKNETVSMGADSDMRNLPAEMASRFAARKSGPTGPGAGGGAIPSAQNGTGTFQGERSSASADAAPGSGESRRPGGASGAGPGGYGGGAGRGPGGAAGARVGADLSQVIPRLPKTALTDLKVGEALMIVASGNAGGPYTAITVLSGVEPLLTGPAGSEITLPPWSSGTGAGGADAGGGGPE